MSNPLGEMHVSRSAAFFVINWKYMPAHSTIGRTLGTTVDGAKKTGKEFAGQTVEQITGSPREKKKPRSSFTQEEAGLLYGDNGQDLPSDEKLSQMDEQSRIDSALLYQDRREELETITSERTGTALPYRQPIANVFNQGKLTTEVSAQEMQTAVQDLRESAQKIGIQNPNTEEQERQQEKQNEAEEEARKKEEEKLKMQTQIEAPPGRITGINFRRKKSERRMQSPPKSAERRAGKDT